MRNKLFLSSLFVIAFFSFGCSPITQAQKEKWNETLPLCYSESDCDAKWSAARQWVQNNSGYKIQIYSDDLIETYNSQQYDPKIAVSVSKNPIGKSSDGEQVNAIVVRISCGNILGCVPTVDEAINSFNNFVSQADINDPDCYINMLTNLEHPKIGTYGGFYKNKNI